jgi:hypothetical protein
MSDKIKIALGVFLVGSVALAAFFGYMYFLKPKEKINFEDVTELQQGGQENTVVPKGQNGVSGNNNHSGNVSSLPPSAVSEENILFVDRTQRNGLAADMLYVVDPLKGSRPINSMENLDAPQSALDYHLAGNRIYFYTKSGNSSEKEGFVKWLDMDGGVHNSVFAPIQDTEEFVRQFLGVLPTDDGKKIFWIEESRARSGQSFEKMILGNTTGSDFKMIFDGPVVANAYFVPLKFDKTGDYIYLKEKKLGLGSYYPLDYGNPLIRVSLQSGEISEFSPDFPDGSYKKDNWVLYAKKDENTISKKVGDISSDNNMVAYYTGGSLPRLIIRDLTSGKETVLRIPVEEGFVVAGSAVFSPDGKYLAYNIGKDDPSKEYFKTIIYDIGSGKQSIIFEDPTGRIRILRWFPGGKLLFSAGFESREYYLINMDGSGMVNVEPKDSNGNRLMTERAPEPSPTAKPTFVPYSTPTPEGEVTY